MAVLVTLEPNDEVDFTYLRDLLEVTDGNSADTSTKTLTLYLGGYQAAQHLLEIGRLWRV